MMKRLAHLVSVAVLAALLCAGMAPARAEDIPALPQPIDWAYALPTPVRAAFAPNLRFDVYSGPGTQYVREANGRASVSTNDWVLVFGEENGWLMVLYRVNEEQVRFGWIEATQEQAGVRVPQFAWANEACEVYDRLSSDPTGYMNQSSELTAQEQATLLGALGEEWGYVQGQTAQGTPMRGFIHVESLSFVTPQEERGYVALRAGQAVPLFDAPGSAQVGALYPGASVAIKERQGDMLRVLCRGNQWVNAILAPVAEGWISALDVVSGTDGRAAMTTQGYAAIHAVSLEGDDVLYMLIAQTDDRVYLELIADGRGTLAPLSALHDASRGMLYAWDGQSVPLYDSRTGGTPAAEGTPGTPVYVLAQEEGMALIAQAEINSFDLSYWVKEENVILVR